ncbi:serine protein kinase RIO [Candidatus Woesearchaeota archaeon]|nr:serine protein kinase RIO [Candidatus Woesearchaeota archaeon]
MVTRTYQERFRTLQGVFDAFTQRNLFELESRRVYDELVMPIKVGKESNVFIAKRMGSKRTENKETENQWREGKLTEGKVKENKEKDSKKNASKENESREKEKYVIVKIYRIQNCDFKRMFHYIIQDPRYDELRQHRREIIFSWVQREYKNLLKAAKAGVNVPKPLGWRAHILVEELIGDAKEGSAAIPLKDALPSNPKKFFSLVVEEMKKLHRAGLIHGDLSSFNILNYKEKPYFIDFSQATLATTPNARELLERDVKNVLQFFKKLGVSVDANEIVKEIMDESK